MKDRPPDSLLMIKSDRMEVSKASRTLYFVFTFKMSVGTSQETVEGKIKIDYEKERVRYIDLTRSLEIHPLE